MLSKWSLQMEEETNNVWLWC